MTCPCERPQPTRLQRLGGWLRRHWQRLTDWWFGRTRVVKPSGTVSLLSDVSSGIEPPFLDWRRR